MPALYTLLGVRGYMRDVKRSLHDHDARLSLVQEKQLAMYRKWAGDASAEKREDKRSLQQEAIDRLAPLNNADGQRKPFQRPSVVR